MMGDAGIASLLKVVERASRNGRYLRSSGDSSNAVHRSISKNDLEHYRQQFPVTIRAPLPEPQRQFLRSGL